MHRQSIEDRFWAKVDKSGDCWLWTGGRAGRGYGVMGGGSRGNQVYTHRISYEIHFGPIPLGFQVCHTCDNPPCVRPEHLFVGTRSDNMKDAKAKGRAKWPVNRGSAHPRARLSDEDVAEIRRLGASIPAGRGRNNGRFSNTAYLTQSMIAQRFGVTDTLIGNILRGKSWRTTP